MKYYDNVLDLIGRTPLVKVNRMVDPDMADIYIKMEQLNPGGSVKDRMAVHMLRKAAEEGLIKPGSTIVESTSGNTGLGLAMASAVMGYRCIFTIPNKMSKEKIDMLKAYGAEVLVTRTDLHHDHPDSYVEVAKRIARETPNSFYTDQYNNMNNPEIHYMTTGPEIWEDTDGKVDCVVGGIGTGGTISGCGRFFKEKEQETGRKVRIVCPDPKGSIYSDVFHKREVEPPGIYMVEGIGHDFMVGTLDMAVIDEIVEVSDRDSFLTARRLVREEGIFSGGSAGTAMFGALQAARELGPGKTVVVIIPDSGDRYISKCFDDEWMKDMGFLGLAERLGNVRELLQFKERHVEFAEHTEKLESVARRMAELGISQMPVRTAGGPPYRMIHEVDVLKALATGECTKDDPATAAATSLNGQVGVDDPLSKVQRVFDENNVAVVMDNSEVIGIITKIDVVEFLAARS